MKFYLLAILALAALATSNVTPLTVESPEVTNDAPPAKYVVSDVQLLYQKLKIS